MNRSNDTLPHKVAVIMSVYRGDDPSHLRSSLHSIFAQTISGFCEIRVYLAVDGPVRSATDQVISDFGSEIYRTFRFEENRGLARVLNFLISSLEDEPFVFRMDADDIAFSDRFQRQLVFMEHNHYVDILGGAILEIGDGLSSGNLVRYPKTDLEARRQIAFRSPVAHPTVCFRRRVFSVAGMYPEVKENEDIAFWFRCMERGLLFANLPDPILKFRVSAGFWGRRGFRKSFSELRCYLKGLNAIEGPSFRMAFPLLRFLFRLLPRTLRKMGYRMRHVRV